MKSHIFNSIYRIIVVSLVLIVSCFNVNIYANQQNKPEYYVTSKSSNITRVGQGSEDDPYQGIEEALANIPDGSRLKLKDNLVFVFKNNNSYILNKSIEIDGQNSYTLNIRGNHLILNTDVIFKDITLNFTAENADSNIYASGNQLIFDNVSTKLSDVQNNERPNLYAGNKNGHPMGQTTYILIKGNTNETVFRNIYAQNDGDSDGSILIENQNPNMRVLENINLGNSNKSVYFKTNSLNNKTIIGQENKKIAVEFFSELENPRVLRNFNMINIQELFLNNFELELNANDQEDLAIVKKINLNNENSKLVIPFGVSSFTVDQIQGNGYIEIPEEMQLIVNQNINKPFNILLNNLSEIDENHPSVNQVILKALAGAAVIPSINFKKGNNADDYELKLSSNNSYLLKKKAPIVVDEFDKENIESIEFLDEDAIKKEYFTGEHLALTNVMVRLIDVNGLTKDIALTNESLAEYNLSTSVELDKLVEESDIADGIYFLLAFGDQNSNVFIDLDLEVRAKPKAYPVRIAIVEGKNTYNENEAFTVEGMVISILYSDQKTERISSDRFVEYQIEFYFNPRSNEKIQNGHILTKNEELIATIPSVDNSTIESNGYNLTVNSAPVDKTEAINAVNQAFQNKNESIDNNNQLTSEEKNTIKQVVENQKNQALEQIEQADTNSQVETAKTEGIAAIDAVEVRASVKPNTKQALTQALNTKLEEIENCSLTAEEKTVAKAQAKEIVDTKAQAIDNADTNANVDTLKQEALTSLNAISLDSTMKANAKNEVNQAKQDKINQIDENNVLTSEEKQEAKDIVNQKATQAITNIDDASDNQAVNTAKENGLNAINTYTKQAETKPNAKQAVLDAFNTKSQEINTRTDLKESEKQDAITRLEAIKNTANNNIDSATTNQAVNNLKQEAINEINTLNPEANSKDEAKAAIQSAIQEKLATVNARKDLTNEEKAVFRNNLEQGKTQAFSSIDRSNDVNEIEQIKQESIRDIQALDIEKTYKQQAKEETDQKLQAKFNQIDGSNLTTEEKDSLKQSLTQNINTQKQAIDDAETVNSVNEARHQITDILDNANLESTMKADAKNAIDQAKQNKISQIDARNDLTDQEKQQAKASVNTKASQAKQAIDYADTNQAVTTAKDEGINEINAVNPNSNAKQDAKDAINQAILEKMNEVNARTDLIDEEKADFQKALDQGKQQIFDAIDRSNNVDEINQIKQVAIENIRSVEIEETYKQQAKDELDDLLQAKINQIDASNLTAEEKASSKQDLTQNINAKKQAIDEASTQAQVDTLRQEASAILENVSLTSNVKAQAKAAITQAQTDKNNSIDARDDLTNEEKASLKQDVETKVIEINTSIDSATTNADVNTAKDNGIVAINSLEKTATSKPEAIASVNQAANTKKAQIDARNDLTNEEKQEAKAQVDTYVDQATLAINQANNDQAVLTAKTASINQINTYNKQAEIKPNAILELTNSADAKKAEIRANNNLTNEEKQEAINSIDALLAQHSLNINQAVNNNDVSSNKQDALTVINGFAKVAKVKNNAISEITTALENKVAEIDASLSLNNEEKASLKNQLELIVNNLKQNINSALSNQEVNDFKAQALNRISQTDLLSHRPIILKDNASKVEVHAADRSIFKNQAVKLHVEKQDANLDNYQNEDVDLYDIDIIDTTTNEKVNFNGSVKVKIEFDKNKTPIKVYYVGEQLEQLDYKLIRENDKAYVEFEATHFSKYAIIFKPTATSDNITTIVIDNNKPNPDVVVVNTVNHTVINNTPKLPNTGANNNYQNLALVMFIIGAYLLKKKY